MDTRTRSIRAIRILTLLAVLVALLLPAAARAQSIPPPAGPVTICGTQAAPAATSYQLVFDAGAPEAVTLTAPAAAACPSGSTHSFTIAAARFPVGQHSVKVLPINTFGTTTTSPSISITVGIAPGAFTPTAVIPG